MISFLPLLKLFICSRNNADPLVSDHRMYHEALPVQAGTKFAANGWIHMYDYQGAFRNGCN
jgi:hypothetical protein